MQMDKKLRKEFVKERDKVSVSGVGDFFTAYFFIYFLFFNRVKVLPFKGGWKALCIGDVDWIIVPSSSLLYNRIIQE